MDASATVRPRRGDAPSRRSVLSLGFAVGALLALTAGPASAQSQVRAPWQPQIPPYETAEITVGDQSLTVDLATTGELRGRGLGYREGLAPGTGMLFVFPEPGPRSFWMKGMRFCLDIIYINDGQIVSAAESVCPEPVGTADSDRTSYPSGVDARFVLEVPAGWLDAHGFGVGTPVVIPASVRADS